MVLERVRLSDVKLHDLRRRIDQLLRFHVRYQVFDFRLFTTENALITGNDVGHARYGMRIFNGQQILSHAMTHVANVRYFARTFAASLMF